MRVRLAAQPYADGLGLLEVLNDALADDRLTELRAVAAWANYRGLDRLRDSLESFRRRNGRASLILGIDEGGATEQGLRLAIELFDRVHVFFSHDERTFHPKLYLLAGTEEARLFVGSNNLTPGGVFFNFEAGLDVQLESLQTDGPDRELFDDVNRYIDGLLQDQGVCKPLDDVLDQLLGDPRFRIRDERRPRRGRKPEAGGEAPAGEDDLPLFGRSGRAMRPTPPGRPVPHDPRTPNDDLAEPDGPADGLAPLPTGTPGTLPPAVTKRWFRRLDPTQAQHPPQGGSQVTGNLKLSKAGHDAIDHKTYFRHEFFGDAHWTAEPRPRGARETAVVPMEVVVGDNNLGVMELGLSHADYRVASQNNVPTWLHWGRDQLMPVLRDTDYSGQYVTLERLADGSGRVTIGAAPTGEFLR